MGLFGNLVDWVKDQTVVGDVDEWANEQTPVGKFNTWLDDQGINPALAYGLPIFAGLAAGGVIPGIPGAGSWLGGGEAAAADATTLGSIAAAGGPTVTGGTGAAAAAEGAALAEAAGLIPAASGGGMSLGSILNTAKDWIPTLVSGASLFEGDSNPSVTTKNDPASMASLGGGFENLWGNFMGLVNGGDGSMIDKIREDTESRREASDRYLEDMGVITGDFTSAREGQGEEARAASERLSGRLGDISAGAEKPYTTARMMGRDIPIVSKRQLMLADQLSDYAGQVNGFLSENKPIRDPLLAALASPVLPGSKDERMSLVNACLRANELRSIKRFEHYQKLAEMAGWFHEHPSGMLYIGDQFITDLLVWYHLAWMGETVRRKNKLIQQLMNKGTAFTLHDRRELVKQIGTGSPQRFA